MDMRNILEILPHRYPFLLVDKVISHEPSKDPKNRTGSKIVAVKNVTANEPFFAGHFPGLPIMPGVLQIEAMAQAACLAFARAGEKNNYFIAGINDARFRRLVVPGDVLMLHAEITKDRGSILIVKTECRVDGQVVSEAEIMAKVSPKDQV